MKKMFEMSMVGELTYFLGLQVKQMDFGIYINQAKYARNLVKRFGLEKAAHARTSMTANVKLTSDPSGVCSRFQSNPKVSHLNAVKRIIKYVSGTCDYGLFYNKESNLSLAGFSDSD